MVDVEKRIVDLLPALRNTLGRSLAPQIKNRFPVEDIVQETFVRAIQNLDTHEDRDPAALLGWLRTIAHRLVIDRIRRKDYHIVTAEDGELLKRLADRSDLLTPSRQVSAQEVKQALTLATSKLSEHHRKVLYMRYVEGRTYVDIASKTGSSAAATRRLHRSAMKNLQQELGRASWYFST